MLLGDRGMLPMNGTFRREISMNKKTQAKMFYGWALATLDGEIVSVYRQEWAAEIAQKDSPIRYQIILVGIVPLKQRKKARRG